MLRLLFLLLINFSSLSLIAQELYFPPAGKWEKIHASKAGFDSIELNEAIRYAISNESKRPRDMREAQKLDFGKEPFGNPIGEFTTRGDPTGLIIHKGYLIAEWGEPERVDMTHSVTKSFLSTVVGLAVDEGLIKNVNDMVFQYVKPVPKYSNKNEVIHAFTTPHNKTISWEVMLRQTSDWEGVMWGKPDWADRPDKDSMKWYKRPRIKPGSVFEYNDVRVNALALAATIVWKRDLPGVLRSFVMKPIDASDTWEWKGYVNSWIVIDDDPIEVVSGGGHWGGGMFINAFDMARFGLLTLNKGKWKDKQIIPESWIKSSVTPTDVRPTYGYMNYFLNTEKKYLPSAPESVFVHVGNGTNMIYVDPENELVIVARWIEGNAIDTFVKMVLSSKK